MRIYTRDGPSTNNAASTTITTTIKELISEDGSG
jgi:hypothetical protein